MLPLRNDRCAVSEVLFHRGLSPAFGPGTIGLWRVAKASPDDRGMPPPVLVLLIAVTFVVVLSLALCGIAGLTGGAGIEDAESTRQRPPLAH